MKPWHDGWPWYYVALVAAFSPFLGVGLVLECVALGLMFEAGNQLRGSVGLRPPAGENQSVTELPAAVAGERQ